MAFDISMGVRRGDAAFKQEIDHLLHQDHGAIDAILAQYHVPLSPDPEGTGDSAQP